MSTGHKKVNIYLKKFLPQQQITENFLDYLQKLILESYATIWQSNGIFVPDIAITQLFSSSAPDTFDLVSPLKGTDGPQGHYLNLDAIDLQQIPFQNSNGIPYYVGARYAEIPESTEINVRTGAIKYVFFKEAVGELADPDSVVDDGDETLTIIVDSVFEAGVSHAGRKVIVWLKDPVSQADTFEECTVLWDGSNNYIETTTALGQTIGNISVDESSYTVFAKGVTVRRNTDLRLDQDIMFLGIVEGAGAGNSPTVFDQSDAQNLSFGVAGLTNLFNVEHSLVDGTHTDITPETITTKQATGGIQFDMQANVSDEDTPDAPVVHTLFSSSMGSGLQDAKAVWRNSGGQVIAFIDAHGNAYFQNLAAVDSIFQANLIVEGNTVLGDDLGSDLVTVNAVLQSLTDMIFVIDSDDNGTNSYKFYNHSVNVLNLLMEVLDTGDVQVLRDVIAGRNVKADEVLTNSGTEYTKNSDQTLIPVDASLNEVFDETLNRKLLRVTPNNPGNTEVLIGPSYITLADGSKYQLPNGPLLSNYAGGAVDFETGTVTGGGANFTPADFTANPDGWFKYSLNLLQSNEILVLPADGFGASQALAPEPPLSEDAIAFCVVAVQNNSGVSVTALQAIIESNITRIPVGGSGGGSGDATTLLGRLEDMQDESFYRFLEPNVFSVDQDDKLTSVDGTYNYTTKTFDFDAGEELFSYGLLDPEFLSELIDVINVQVALVFEPGFEDTAPIVELSRDGGDEYQAVTMERIGESDTFVGAIQFEAEATKQNLHENALANADADLVLNATTTQSRSQEFTAAQYEVLEKINAYVNKLGSPTGYLYIRVVADDAGSPSTDGADVLSELIVNIVSLSAGDNTISLDIGKRVLANAQKVHLVFSTDDEYKSVFSAGVDELRIKADSSAPVVPDSQSFNGTVWAAVVGSALVYKIEGRVLDLRMRYEASMATKLKGYGVFYGAEFESVTRLKKRAQFVFNGTTDNLNEFQLPSGFNADPDFLKCYHVYNGQTFVVPSFELQNNKAVFPVDFFLGEEAVHLIFSQPEQGSYDESDDNKKLLAENHLGSQDVSLDRSVSGRGINLREDITAILRECWLDEFGNLNITLPKS